MQPLALISICSSLVLVRFASTLVIRSRSKLNRCETTSRRWFSLIRIKLLIRISWCSVNARKGAKPVSLRIKSASVNGVLETTSRHGTTGRDRSRSVAPCQIYRVDARVGATDLSANQPLLAHAFLIYFFPF